MKAAAKGHWPKQLNNQQQPAAADETVHMYTLSGARQPQVELDPQTWTRATCNRAGYGYQEGRLRDRPLPIDKESNPRARISFKRGHIISPVDINPNHKRRKFTCKGLIPSREQPSRDTRKEHHPVQMNSVKSSRKASSQLQRDSDLSSDLEIFDRTRKSVRYRKKSTSGDSEISIKLNEYLNNKNNLRVSLRKLQVVKKYEFSPCRSANVRLRDVTNVQQLRLSSSSRSRNHR